MPCWNAAGARAARLISTRRRWRCHPYSTSSSQWAMWRRMRIWRRASARSMPPWPSFSSSRRIVAGEAMIGRDTLFRHLDAADIALELAARMEFATGRPVEQARRLAFRLDDMARRIGIGLEIGGEERRRI